MTDDEMLLRCLRGGSSWHCEERIKTTLDAFVECWPGLKPSTAYMRQQHYAAARVLVNEVGEMEAPAYVRWAYTEIQNTRHGDPLFIKTCRSLLFLLERWRSREVGPEWYRKPCPKCSTIHPPGTCPEDLEDEDG